MITAIHIELNALCLLMLYAIVHQTVANVNQQMSRVLFRSLVYGVIAALSLDTLWLLVEGRAFPGAVFINSLVNALYLAGGVILGGVWYLYVLETLGYSITRRLQTRMMIPGLVFLVLNLISIWTGWIFTVSADNVYEHGPLFWLQMIGAYGMLLLPLIHLVIFLLRNRERGRRRVALSLLSFYAVPIVGTIVSMFYTGMPGAWTCASISLVLLYMNDQDNEIVRDGLTGLNNRKTLPGVFSEYVKQDQPLYLLMMDLDSFKKINDTYGHPEGDQALVNAAHILTGAMAGRRGLVVRYGGDEFLVMTSSDPEALERDIQAGFAQYRKEHCPPYTFATSVGIAQYKPGQSLESLIEEADNALYEVKQHKKVGR